jgi:hypothetical protein
VTLGRGARLAQLFPEILSNTKTYMYIMYIYEHHDTWVWWYTPVIPEARSPRQDYHEFKLNLNYIVRPCVKNKSKNKQNETLH